MKLPPYCAFPGVDIKQTFSSGEIIYMRGDQNQTCFFVHNGVVRLESADGTLETKVSSLLLSFSSPSERDRASSHTFCWVRCLVLFRVECCFRYDVIIAVVVPLFYE